eukprot:356096-Chlamydomonas_euryale.AAC.4
MQHVCDMGAVETSCHCVRAAQPLPFPCYLLTSLLPEPWHTHNRCKAHQQLLHQHAPPLCPLQSASATSASLRTLTTASPLSLTASWRSPELLTREATSSTWTSCRQATAERRGTVPDSMPCSGGKSCAGTGRRPEGDGGRGAALHDAEWHRRRLSGPGKNIQWPGLREDQTLLCHLGCYSLGCYSLGCGKIRPCYAIRVAIACS